MLRRGAGGFYVARFGGHRGSVATPRVTSTYYNPAGLALLGGTKLYLEGLFAHRSVTYSRPTAGIDTLLVGGQVGVGTPGCAVSRRLLVVLKAFVNGKYVAAENNGNASLIANRSSARNWETFDLFENADDTVSLRAHANDRYVTAENGGNAALIANRTARGPWEKFTLIKNADGTVSFRSKANARIMTAENAGNSALIANRNAIGPWEKFYLEYRFASLLPPTAP